MPLTLQTPVIELPRYKAGRLSVTMAGKLASALRAQAGVSEPEGVTVADLLSYFPARYEDRSNFITLDQLEDGMEAAVELYVRTSGAALVGRNRDPRKPHLFLFEITGGDAERRLKPVSIKWFISGKNARHIVEYYNERFARGTRLVAYGKWEYDARKQIFFQKVAKPDELEILPQVPTGLFARDADDEGGRPEEPKVSEDRMLEDDVSDPESSTVHTARIVPVYRKLGQFRTKRIREIIYDVLGLLDRRSVADPLPVELTKREKLLPYFEAIEQIHFPPADSTLSGLDSFRSDAQRRIIFDEFFWLSFSMQLLRGEREREKKAAPLEVSDITRERLRSIIPFSLTAAQKRVIGEIFADLKSDTPMNRLIQGDVGSGKTIVAFLAIFAAMENGHQAALMAPTEILAEQHARNAAALFTDTGYRVETLMGSTRAARKREFYEGLESGEISLVIGTHAIIQDAVRFADLRLAVIDEQHRFGVLQRAQLKAGGMNPDVLVMTATPIPRSLAMTVYGDLDVSVIDELPPGRTPIRTVVVGEDERRGVYRGIEREVRLGRQCYIVYPLIEESAKTDLKAANEMYEDLRSRVFPQFTVGLMHGKLKAADKEAVMKEFVAGRLDILVSTTVVEVGVDVPNASLMVIEHAERFGLSQLHQLRGRVGRGSEKSYCVLLTGDKKTAVAKERLGIMEQTSDGFKIAEKDLEIRGQGEILGTRQSGLENFRMANIVRDLDILVRARQAAEHYLGEKRTTPETARMVKLARSRKTHRLGSIG